ESAGQGRVDVGHRLRNAIVMEHVFGPPITNSRQHAVEVLHAAGHADPVVGLELRKRNHNVSLSDALGEVKYSKSAPSTAIASPGGRLVVQVGKLESAIL